MDIINNIVIAGYKKDDDVRTPKEAPEGIITGKKRVLTKTQIETLDLLSEGEIHGLATGEYIGSGFLGQIGWSGLTFKPNTIAIGTNGFRWLQSIFWNDVPVVDKEGKFNFQQVAISGSRGNPNGGSISDDILDELTVTRLISERLRAGEQFSKIYRILDKDCIGAGVNIRINQLSATSTKKKTMGDIITTSIEYSIFYRPVFYRKPAGDFIVAQKENISGKITAGYIRATKILFNNDYSNDDDFIGWEIKITRWTAESTTSTVRNQSFIDSLTEIYGSKFIYPNSAIYASMFDSEFFNSVPNRTYLSYGLKVAVPDNYNPIYKTYDETSPWDGTFKTDGQGRILKEWTDNPVWCYYDLLTNKRYGLGQYVDADLIDKFTLYEISKYCDALVSDGYGGLEPRFTCNAYITTQEEAYDLINSMASVFRGITYYSAGQIYTSQDAEKQPIYQFTNANVVDGDFVYSSSAKKARHTIAVVRYNDKRNDYKPALEYVENVEGIRKYGLRDIEVPAFGCTSRGQAIRLGRWALLTESLETESVNFRAGVEVAGFLKPGDVFQIYDANRKTQRLGGRLTNIVALQGSTNLTLDSEITGFQAGVTYKFSLLTPSYYYDTSIVTGLNSNDIPGLHRPQIQYLTFNTSNVTTVGNKTNINVSTALDVTGYHVSGNLVWLIEATGNNVIGNIKADEWETYRLINIKEVDPYTYDIEGLQYDINKFVQVESGFSFTDTSPGIDLEFASPTALDLSLRRPKISENSELIDYKFSISDLTNIKGFKVFATNDGYLPGDIGSGNHLIAELPKNMTSGSYFPSQDGTYEFRVYSLGINNLLSTNYANGSITVSNINPIKDLIISSLQLDQETLDTNDPGTSFSGIYSTHSPTFAWQVGIGAIVNIPTDISYRITARRPSQTNTPSSEIYYEITGYNSNTATFTFNFDENYSGVSNVPNGPRGPFREYDLVVEGITSGIYSPTSLVSYTSAGSAIEHDADGNLVQDSDYKNSNGYDILYANNPPPVARHLYTGKSTTEFYQTGYATQQWITQDGEVKMFFSRSGNLVPLSGFFGDDIAGGILYYSDEWFLPEEAKNQIPNTKTINRITITSEDNPIIVPLDLKNVNKRYIALSPFDSFDEGINTINTGHLYTGLSISNVIEIKRQFSSQVYSAWVQFEISTANGGTLLNTWRERSFNIDTINVNDAVYSTDNKDYPAMEIIFEDPLPSPYYAINFTYHRSNPRVLKPFSWFGENKVFPFNREEVHFSELNEAYNVPQIYNSDETKIVLPSPASMLNHVVIGQGATGRFFLGVIYNN